MEVYYEDDILSIEQYKNVLGGIKSGEEFRQLFDKLYLSFIRNESNTRKQFIDIFLESTKLSGEDLIFLGKDSFVGNITVLYAFLKNVDIINESNVNSFIKLASLEFISERDVFELTPLDKKISISFNERIGRQLSEFNMKDLMMLLEKFFAYNLISISKDNFESLLHVYSSHDNIGKDKQTLLDALLNNKENLFISALRKYDHDITTVANFMDNYTRIYSELRKAGHLTIFDYNNLVFNGACLNNNSFPVLYKNRRQEKKILMPFLSVSKEDIETIFDPDSNRFITPKHICKGISLSEIFSFSKVRNSEKSTSEENAIVQNMDEDTIMKKIRTIISEPNLTSHGPTEVVDILTGKIKLNDNEDLRESAFIIKGKSFNKVNSQHIGHQIIKAIMNSNAEIIFLIHVHPLLNEARSQFTFMCGTHHKLYCILNWEDLAQLFKTYSILN